MATQLAELLNIRNFDDVQLLVGGAGDVILASLTTTAGGGALKSNK